ncbi:MAG: hypothetical protein JNL69_12075 [Bacteroidia bacterium]|nr:hypothetical protein [Bacteroidia bacterium]
MNRRYAIFVFLFGLTVGSVNVFAYELGDTVSLKKNKTASKKEYPYQPTVFKTSPTAFLWGGVFPLTSEYRFMVEMPSARAQSEQIAISVLGKNIFWTAMESSANVSTDRMLKVKGWRLQYAHKYYLVNKRHHSPYGFYVGPLISYTNAKISIGLNRYYSQAYFDVRNFNANLMMGVQFGKFKRTTMDIYWGIGYKHNEIYYHSNTFKSSVIDTREFGDFYSSNVNLVFGINLGYSL